jgi:PAS domain S-box-containing protein
VLNPDGDVESVAIFASNVTARKVAQGRLRKSEEKIRSLVGSANEGIVSVSSDGRIELANSAAERMFGYGQGELNGQAIETLVPERHRDRHVRDRTGYIADPEPRPRGKGMALVGWRKDGTEFSVEIALSPVEGSDSGEIVAIISDITDRKLAEEDIRQSAERNASLLKAIPDMIFTLDRRGIYLDFVPAEGQDPYLSEDDFLGRTVSEVMPPALAQDMLKAIELALDTGLQQQLAYELEISDEKHHYEVRILRSKDDEALAIVRDVTAAKRLEREEQLRKDRDELEGSVEKAMLGKNPYGLTFREFTVLHLAADGEADKAIADQLGISTFTVSKHIANILGKMAASSRTEACVRALREGLLT